MISKKSILSISLAIFLIFLCGYFSQANKSNLSFQKNKKQEIIQPAYEIKVEVTNVEVIVTDKKGNRVTGLQPENFEIFEDGIIQKLTNFYEVRGTQVFSSAGEEDDAKMKQKTQPLPDIPANIRNRIIFFFDNWHLHPANRNWVTKKLAPFIQSNIQKNKSTQGMVISLDRRIEILQDFTSNPYSILQAIDDIKNKSGNAILRARAREDLQKELNRIMRGR